MKERMKKIVSSFSLAIVLLLITVTGAIAYTYTAEISVTESGGNSYTYLPYIISIDNDYLADNSYIESTGLDTRVELGATELVHLVTDDKLIFVIPSLSQNSSASFNYLFGEDALSSFPILVGYSGFITIADDADLEPGNNFQFEFLDTYVDASSGASKNLIYKQDAFKLYVSSANVITAEIPTEDYGHSATWQSPTSASGTSWVNPNNTWDNSTGTYAEYALSPYSWSDYITMPTDSLTCGKIRHYMRSQGGNSVDYVEIGTYYEGAWHTVYTALTEGSWVETEIGSFETVTSARMRFSEKTGAPQWVRLYEFDYNEAEAVTLSVTSACATGEHDIKVTADGTNLKLYVDSVLKDTESLAGNSVPDNANNWLLMQNNVAPYAGYYKHTVSGTLIAWYQPVDMIATTVLPDRQGAAENGAITWGSNPADISDSIGSLTSESQPSVSPGASPGTTDALPPLDQPAWFETSDLSSNPFHPLVEALANYSGFGEWQIWLGAASILIAGLMATLYAKFRNQFLAGALGTAAAALFVAIGIYPWWVLILFGFMLVATIVFERKPVV